MLFKRSLLKPEIVILAAGLVILIILAGSVLTVQNLFAHSFPLAMAEQKIFELLNTAHLEVENVRETPSRDTAIVFTPLAKAEALAQAMAQGGDSEYGVLNTEQAPEIRALAAKLVLQIQDLEVLTSDWIERIQQGQDQSAAEARYTTGYKASLATIAELEAAIIARTYAAQQTLFNFGILLVALVVVIFSALMLMWTRNRRIQEAMNQGLEERIRVRTAELASERNLMRTLIDNVPDLVYAKDCDSKFILVNKALAASMGAASPAELLGKSDFDFHPRALAEEFRADEVNLMAQHEPMLSKVEKVILPDGAVMWLSSTKVPLMDASGAVIGLVGINRDMTATRTQALQLQEREAQYRRVVENTHEGIVSTNAANKIVFHNARALEILGYSAEELSGMSPVALFAQSALETPQPIRPGNTELRMEGEYPFRRKGGGDGWMHTIATQMHDDFGAYAGTLYMFADITERKNAEDAVHANEALYRSLVQAMPQCVFRKDRNGQFTFGNARFWEIMNVPPDSLLGKTDYAVMPQTLADKYRADDLRVLDHGITLETVEDLQVWQGETRIIRTVKTPVYDQDGAVVGIQGMFWDITDGRRQNDQIRKLSRAVEASSGLIVITDTAGRIEYVNPAFTEVTGYTFEEVLGKNPNLLKSGKTPPDIYEAMWHTIRSGKVWRGEFLNRKKNGDLYWEFASISPLMDEQGVITHYVAVQEDITERKESEEKLRRQNEYLDALHATTLGLMGRLRVKDLLQALTARAASLAGTEHGFSFVHEADEADMEMKVGIGVFEHWIGSKVHWGDGFTGKVWETGEVMVLAQGQEWEPQLDKMGTEPLHSVVAIPLKSGDRVSGVFGIGSVDPQRHFDETDLEFLLRFANLASIALDNARLYADAEREIAERKRAMEQLHERQELLARVLDTVEDGIYLVDTSGKMTFANRATKRIIGVAEEGIVGSTYNDVRWQITTPDGRPFPEEEQPFARVMATGESVYNVEQIILRPDGRRVIVSINAAPQHDAYGNIIGEVASLTDITERKRAEQELLRQKELLQAAFDNIPVMIGLYDAKGRFTLVNQEWQNALGYSLEEMNQGDVWSEMYPDTDQRLQMRSLMVSPLAGWRDFRTVVRDGHAIDTSWTMAHLSTGMTIAFGQDITKRKEVDRLKNEFISTVSHELRTPLTSIRGSLGLIAGGIAGPVPERVKGMIDIAYKNSERLVRLINDILDIEKIESGKMVFQFKPLELMPLLAQVLEANRSYAEQYQVRLEIVRDEPHVKVNADADRLTQVLTNLISNAAKFSPPGSTVQLSVERGRSVRVSVRDQGPGIPLEFQSRIFQKFAQADSSDTRQKGGTGLGLSIAKAIVEKHGGVIGFDTVEGQGTVFYFELPEWVEPAPLASVSPTAKPRILICEDDRDVALLLYIMLEQNGFDADVAYNATEARTFLATRHYAALTLDLMLPDKDGISLIRELRAEESTRTLPIVVISAKADQGRYQLNGDAVWVTDWLQKPIDQKRLVDAVSGAARHSANQLPQILHVEDDMDVRQVVEAILHETAVVSAAQDLAHAREMLTGHTYDLVILDPSLPDGSGMDLLPLLRDGRGQTPVVLFTANDNDPHLMDKVSAALVKSRTSNQELLETITGLIRYSKGDVSGE